MATATIKTKTKNELISGADILVQSLVNHGVDTIFAYPGGCSMPLHQALTRFSDRLRTILPRHEQGGAFAAQGVARSTGRVGVCMATSGPGATNLDRKSTRLNSSHSQISYAVFCLKKKKQPNTPRNTNK